MKEIKEALSKITPGTWEIKQDKFFANTKGISSNGYYIGGGFNEGDAHLIVNAPEWLASLVSKVEEMQKALESVKSDISFLKNDYPNDLWTRQETARWEEVADDAIKEIDQALKGDTQ